MINKLLKAYTTKICHHYLNQNTHRLPVCPVADQNMSNKHFAGHQMTPKGNKILETRFPPN